MRTVAEPTFVQTSNVGETKKASIKTSAKMFNFFSKQIYSDFYTAVWRELVSNGIDGQKVNGETRPLVVTVPSMLEPYAKVRDFGCSMDHEFMMNQFMQFGDASTKENSDDYIGGFGIGSKAPLSYTEQYSIKCFQNGVVRVYSVFKDEEGCPSIAFLSEAPTSEPDGVEVGFPVRQDDISKFTDTVVSTLQYFDPQPILENTELKLEPVKYDAKGAKWGIRVTGVDRKPKIIIGGVSYPLDVTKVPYNYTNIRTFAQMGLDIYLDIGEANIALSREHVTHDEDLFIKLNNIISGIGEEFGKQMSKVFDNCKTAWEAKKKLAESLQGADYATTALLRKHAYWKGQQFNLKVERPQNYEVLIIAFGDFGWQSSLSGIPSTQAMSPKFRAWQPGANFQPNTFDRIIIDDGEDKPALRIRAVTDHYGSDKILFLRWNDPAKKPDWDGYLKALGSPPASMIEKLSKYQPMKIARATVGNSARPFKCFVGGRPYRGNTHRAMKDLPKGGGLYVVMDNFTPLSSGKDIQIAQQSNPTNTIWLNKTDFISSGVEKDSAWYSVEQGIEKVKEEYRTKYKNLPEAEAWCRLQSNNSVILSDLERLSNLEKFPKQGPLFQLNKLRLKHDDVAETSHSKIRSELLGVKWEDHFLKMEQLVKDAEKRHPYIKEICQHYHSRKLSNELINALF